MKRSVEFPSGITRLITLALLSLLCAPFPGHSQSAYPSILWEITGNGLQKPSYLFGSMHISSKEVFHLSDSFYRAIRSCEVVALEVDPKEWQPDMFRLRDARQAGRVFGYNGVEGLLMESDFRFKDYGDALKSALRAEPFVLNGLLYRTTAPMANYQEDTYLDLYIYQTGRRLGKAGTGVENYLQSEKISIEAGLAAMKDKSEPKPLPEGENMASIATKMQEAYRRGDLSLMDSLDQMLEVSKAYTEKFLYDRNEIQAHSIDSIIRQRSLFVAVGAAHLPGSRGVIEILRKKGYTLRPVKMDGQDTLDRDEIDRIHVPVESHPVLTADGFIRCNLPGQWYKRDASGDISDLQYADMENGSYYLLTRVKTHAGLRGQSVQTVLKSIDSVLYDNIPGKILSKQEIWRDGYSGYEILNKTRNGDMQRYMILVTPVEIIVFKMSGNEDYVSGKEADDFFASIHLQEPAYQWTDFQPPEGGFRVAFPSRPMASFTSLSGRGQDIWQYEAGSASGETYLLLKAGLNNTRFLDEDTVDLRLMEESLKGSGIITREISRKWGRFEGRDCLDMDFATAAGGKLRARAVISGPQHYLLLAAAKKDNGDFDRFFGGFTLTPYRYGKPKWYTDTARHFSVLTPVSPDIPENMRFLAEFNAFNPPDAGEPSYTSDTRVQYANFRDDSTGESVFVTVRTLPDYFYRKDSARFWENEIRWTRLTAKFILEKKDYFSSGDSVCGYLYTLLDTNTNRKIRCMAVLKGNRFFELNALTDNLTAESPFISGFYSSFSPLPDSNQRSVFAGKSALFFERYHSQDSVVRKIARDALSHIVFEPSDLGAIRKCIEELHPDKKTYIETKGRWIRSLGRIRDSVGLEPVVDYLRQVYEASGDTGVFQNAALEAMVRLHSPAAYALVKEWIVQRTPVFETTRELQDLFRRIGDDSALALSLFPDILQLVPVEGYKVPILQLMVGMADSNRLPATAYQSYFTGLFSDAQLLLKKQQLTEESADDEDDDGNVLSRMMIPNRMMNIGIMDENVVSAPREYRSTLPRLDKYAGLLLPFYDRPAVAHWFSRLLQTRSLTVKEQTALLLIRNHKPVPDTVLRSLAADDRHRARLYEALVAAGRTDLFPSAWKTQEAMAVSVLWSHHGEGNDPEVQAVGRQRVVTRRATGYVYFFKYKLKGEAGWRMAYSGVQPDRQSEVNTGSDMVQWTRLPLSDGSPELQQFQNKLPQWILSQRESAAWFYMQTGRFGDMFTMD